MASILKEIYLDSLFDTCNENDDIEYKRIFEDELYRPVFPLINDFWKRYSPYADANFKKYLKADFISRIWELWLGNVLLHEGFELPLKNTTDWPDFIAHKNDSKYYIEAIAPKNSPDDSGNHIPDLNPYFFQEIKPDLYELRIQDAIIKKFQKKYTDQVKDNAIPYIIAINISKLPFSKFTFGDIPWVIKALFPIGPEIATIDKKNNSFTYSRLLKKYNEKKTGHQKDKCIFNTRNYSYLSAVIFSDVPINLEEGKITEKLYIIKNPFALYPTDENFGCTEVLVNFNEKEFYIELKESSQ